MERYLIEFGQCHSLLHTSTASNYCIPNSIIWLAHKRRRQTAGSRAGESRRARRQRQDSYNDCPRRLQTICVGLMQNMTTRPTVGCCLCAPARARRMSCSSRFVRHHFGPISQTQIALGREIVLVAPRCDIWRKKLAIYWQFWLRAQLTVNGARRAPRVSISLGRQRCDSPAQSDSSQSESNW